MEVKLSLQGPKARNLKENTEVEQWNKNLTVSRIARKTNRKPSTLYILQNDVSIVYVLKNIDEITMKSYQHYYTIYHQGIRQATQLKKNTQWFNDYYLIGLNLVGPKWLGD